MEFQNVFVWGSVTPHSHSKVDVVVALQGLALHNVCSFCAEELLEYGEEVLMQFWHICICLAQATRSQHWPGTGQQCGGQGQKQI